MYGIGMHDMGIWGCTITDPSIDGFCIVQHGVTNTVLSLRHCLAERRYTKLLQAIDSRAAGAEPPEMWCHNTPQNDFIRHSNNPMALRFPESFSITLKTSIILRRSNDNYSRSCLEQIIPQPTYYGPLPSKQKAALSSLSKLALILSACKGDDFIGFCFALVATVPCDPSANAPKTSLSQTALVSVFP
jgi:hypothetical protein